MSLQLMVMWVQRGGTSILLSRQAVADNRLHHVAEAIEFRQRGVNVWGNADALKLFMHNWRGEDAMFAEQVAGDLSRIDSFDLHVGNRAHLVRIEGSVEANFGDILQLIHPIARQ